MARIDWVDRRLRAWGAWMRGQDASGYSGMSPLHKDWTPPTPGTTPIMRVGPHSDGRTTHESIRRAVDTHALSQRQADTLVMHYCYTLSVADQAARLGCQPETVDARIRAAHLRLARWWGDPAPQGVLHN